MPDAVIYDWSDFRRRVRHDKRHGQKGGPVPQRRNTEGVRPEAPRAPSRENPPMTATDDEPTPHLRIDDKIAAKLAEVEAAQDVCAQAAYDLADAWDVIGNAHRDHHPADTIDDAPAKAAEAYREACITLRRRRAELAQLETQRKTVLKRSRR
jgi:hypothetical protein